ncbi:TrmH family RNA methyltransferase [Streptomyces sp. SID3343]|uniref:TrmH family RNA methyltransferase n=1 Tax=Streptomyces sp. SID3343 TaxID=2690260 RepID=UPI001368335F|nr:TrmH family RNA methyltransferase [Streptomyces sp. SID3343]MYW01837.1 rRNA methyltransferase [Streptomyces sp. SID3343]
MDAFDAETVALWRAASVGAVVLDGFHAVKHAIRFGAQVRVVVTGDLAAACGLAQALADDVRAYIEEHARQVSPATLRELVPRGSPTGVVALAGLPRAGVLGATRSAPVVVLENPRNLGNVGAVVRLAAGYGASAVLTTGELDPWHPNVVRGSAGLHFATTVERVSPGELPAGPVYVLDPEGDDLRAIEIPDDAVLAFGTERHGVSAALRARADRLVAIPMRPGVSSYNLATSVGMTLFRWSTTSEHAPG